nr:uncharacterized protein LOC104111773 [Nicotiana tomentosiformis]
MLLDSYQSVSDPSAPSSLEAPAGQSKELDLAANTTEAVRFRLDWCMTRSSGKVLLPYESKIEKQPVHLRKEINLPANTEKTNEKLDAHGTAVKELGTYLRSLERQVRQIATILSERIPGTLPANTKKNPKEMVNGVTLRSGQVLKDPTPIHKEVAPEKETGKELKIEDGDKKTKKKKGKEGAKKKKKEETSRKEESNEERSSSSTNSSSGGSGSSSSRRSGRRRRQRQQQQQQ